MACHRGPNSHSARRDSAAPELASNHLLDMHRHLLALFLFAPVGLAQTGTLIGDDPDQSNWPHPKAPTSNPYPRSTASPDEVTKRDEIAQLGKALFWEEQVSSDNTMACGTCHSPAHGGIDGRPGGNHTNGNVGSFGVVPQAVSQWGTVDFDSTAPSTQATKRGVTPVAAPTMIGAYLFEKLFWNLRAGPDFADANGNPLPGFATDAALEALAVEPPLSAVEMGHEGIAWSGFLQAKLGTSLPLAMVDPATIPADIQWIVTSGANYHAVFDTVFSGYSIVGNDQGVTRERFAMAIAHYLRTLIPDHAPIDLGTMTAAQIRGFDIMKQNTHGSCFSCHSHSGDPTLTSDGKLDDPFDNLFSDGDFTFIGLFNGKNIDQPARKTATLRNLRLHPAFFSIGKAFTQTQLIDFYVNGVRHGSPDSATTFGPLTTQQRLDVADFLFNALTDPRVTAEQAPFDHPRLYSSTVTFGANKFGVGTPPAGLTLVPEIIANSPPLIPKGNEPIWLKLGVARVEPNALTAVLFSLAQGTGSPLWVGSPMFFDYGHAANVNGYSTYRASFPLNASLVGVPLHFQWQVQGAHGDAWSNAATFVPFQY
ncbi:MAG: cytochrome-c peroxidase [Planctomycetota bacterium]